MNYIAVVILMTFGHLMGDYLMQGILASMKQKRWWRDLPNYQEQYKYDYISALFAHSFIWSFMVMLPVFYLNGFYLNCILTIAFIVNIVAHMYIDDLKANKNKINLVQDQSFHLIQVVLSSFLYFL